MNEALSLKITEWLNSIRITYPDYKFFKKNKNIPFHLRARLVNQYRKSPNGKIMM